MLNVSFSTNPDIPLSDLQNRGNPHSYIKLPGDEHLGFEAAVAALGNFSVQLSFYSFIWMAIIHDEFVWLFFILFDMFAIFKFILHIFFLKLY